MTTPTLKEELDQFCLEAVDCYHHFRQSRVIFDQPQDKLDILNETAQHFFSLLNNMFLNGIVLNMARLTDRAEMYGSKNLSIRRIHGSVLQDPKRPKGLHPLVEELHAIAEESDTWRNKLTAHIDYEAALGTLAIPPLHLDRVQHFYDVLQEFINLIYRALYDTVYPIDAVDTRGADELLRTIRYAHALRQYDRTHIRLFDQIINGKLPSARGMVWALGFCPGCVPAINGLEITKDTVGSLPDYMGCQRCKRQFCQNQGCKHPFDADTASVVVPFMIYHMTRPLICSACTP